MSNPSEMTEPRLSADFASRVLRRADLLKARRRRTWRIATVGAVVSFAAVVAAYEVVPSNAPVATAARPGPLHVAASAPANQSGETDVLDFLFPDAAPVARFAAQYSEDEDTDSAPGLFDDDDADTS
ncbi:MAG TPA: hypothetical protein VHX61_15210 [Rhizomicrobium sp.]|jgi:hypothetical protein|nr:hypothetical protein [Rhizomicrobium sp.]